MSCKGVNPLCELQIEFSRDKLSFTVQKERAPLIYIALWGKIPRADTHSELAHAQREPAAPQSRQADFREIMLL